MSTEKFAAVLWRFVGIWMIAVSTPMLAIRLWRLVSPPSSNASSAVEWVIPNLNPTILLGPAILLGLGCLIFWKSRSLGALISRGLE